MLTAAIVAGGSKASIKFFHGVMGDMSITFSNVGVAGYSEDFGVLDLPACDGSVEISVSGAYRHDPG